MKTPPLLLGAGLLFWGWYGGLLAAAVPLALIAEGARFVSWRWELQAKDYYRVADLCSLIFIGIVGWQLINARFPETLFRVLLWSPCAVFPLLLAQCYGGSERVPLEALFLSLRNPKRTQTEPLPGVDVSYPFLAVCLIAAAGANPRTPWFFAGVAGLAGWALWSQRTPRAKLLTWTAAFVAAAGIGYLGQLGLAHLQGVIEEIVTDWMIKDDAERDPFKSSTRIGSLGKLKLSDRVLLRLEPMGSEQPPSRLIEAVYTRFAGQTWFAPGVRFDPVSPGSDPKSWRLGGAASSSGALRVSIYLKDGKGLLPLPAGTRRVSELPALALEMNEFGTVKAADAPGFVSYVADYGAGGASGSPPGAGDLQVPAVLDKTLSGLADELRLAGKTPAQAVAAVEDYFARDYRYSLHLGDRELGARPLTRFLRQDRVGHCEYFATATVLLLRKAGIPARYAVGYAVAEHSVLQKQYLVRSRHAHSWALAYVDGAWREVDTTPSVWASVEEQEASLLQPLLDLGSYVYYRYSRWRWREGEEGGGAGLAWVAALLALYLLWRVFRGSRRKQPGAAAAETPAAQAGDASAFYMVMERLEALGHHRGQGEPLQRWIDRITRLQELEGARSELAAMLAVHYRLRFDPAGATPMEEAALRDRANDWLRRSGSSSPPSGLSPG